MDPLFGTLRNASFLTAVLAISIGTAHAQADGNQLMGPSQAVEGCGFDELGDRPGALAKAVAAPAPAQLRWAALNCRFTDPSGIEFTTAFIEDVFERPDVGLLDYFERMANGHTTMSLPIVVDVHVGQPVSSFPFSNPSQMVDMLSRACLDAAEPMVDFNTVNGLLFFFNNTLYQQSYGAPFAVRLEGVERTVPAAWMSANQSCGPTCTAPAQPASTIAHEIGHAMNLRHVNNSDGDGDPYDNAWDVMSGSWRSKRGIPVLGSLPRSLNAHQRLQVGWVDEPQVLRLPTDAGPFAESFHLNHDPASPGLQLAIVDLPGSMDVVLTARSPGQVDDSSQTEPFVLVYTHDPVTRPTPLWLVDQGDPMPSIADSATSYFTAGESYKLQVGTDTLSVRVVSSTAQGHEVTVSFGPDPVVFFNGFEP
jgi:M6 family metalloprotease-like protein